MLPLAALAGLSGCGRERASTQAFNRYFPAHRDAGEGKRPEASGAPRLKLRLIRVVDERLPNLDREGFAVFQKTLGDWVEKGSRRPVELDLGEIRSIESFFSLHKPVVQHARATTRIAEYFDPSGPEGLNVVRQIVRTTTPKNMRELYPDAPASLEDLDGWARYACVDLAAKLRAFAQPHPPHPALRDPNHPEYNLPGVWRALAQAEKADVIVTNAFIAGPERSMDVDRLRRGGLLVGLWSAQPKPTDLGATVVFSIQPMLCRAPFTLDFPDPQRPVLAGVCAWLFFQSRWEGAAAVVDPLGKAASLMAPRPQAAATAEGE
ncbi:MAG: hypothetical protein M5U26_15515 [Planctomycetota bacterium]|nr:hypothetical protein [Planctomycetota bacterium]